MSADKNLFANIEKRFKELFQAQLMAIMIAQHQQDDHNKELMSFATHRFNDIYDFEMYDHLWGKEGEIKTMEKMAFKHCADIYQLALFNSIIQIKNENDLTLPLNLPDEPIQKWSSTMQKKMFLHQLSQNEKEIEKTPLKACISQAIKEFEPIKEGIRTNASMLRSPKNTKSKLLSKMRRNKAKAEKTLKKSRSSQTLREKPKASTYDDFQSIYLNDDFDTDTFNQKWGNFERHMRDSNTQRKSIKYGAGDHAAGFVGGLFSGLGDMAGYALFDCYPGSMYSTDFYDDTKDKNGDHSLGYDVGYCASFVLAGLLALASYAGNNMTLGK